MIFAAQWLLFDIRMTFLGLKIAINGTLDARNIPNKHLLNAY